MAQQRQYQSNAQRQAAYRQRAAQARTSQLSERGLPPLPAIPSIPGQQRWKTGLEHVSFLLETINREMLEYYQERSEQWQESERGAAHQKRQQALEELAQSVRDLSD